MPTTQLSEHEISVIQEAKTLIEKMNLITQSQSKTAEHDPIQLGSPPTGDANDAASDFSGYSMLTPSAATKSDRDEVKSPSEQQAPSEESPEEDAVSDADDLESNAGDFGVDESDGQQQAKDSAAAERPPMMDTTVLQQQGRPTKQKSKLVGIVITLGQGIDSDEGEKAARSIGDHLGRIPALAGQISVLSFEGDEPLEVALTPQPDPNDDPFRGFGKPNELVATLHRTTGSSKPQNNSPEPIALTPDHEFPFMPFPPDPASFSPMPGKTATLLAQRIELAEARTLRSLIGSKNNICPCNGFAGYTTNQFEAPKIAESNGTPKLTDLIEIAKAKVQHELTARVYPAGGLVDAKAMNTSVVPETTKSFQTQFWGSKSMMYVRGERVIISGIVMLFLAVTLAGLTTAYINAQQSRVRCLGISWKA